MSRTLKLAFASLLPLWENTAAALREIFDEAAYARFLARTGQPSSRAAYSAFLRDRTTQQERRPRCC